MYDNKRGMIRCLFLEGDWTCAECDMFKRGICEEAFYKKHGRFPDGYNY
jgi:hypothetical protein